MMKNWGMKEQELRDSGRKESGEGKEREKECGRISKRENRN